MIDRDYGNWLAGFIDGEGCFYITRDRTRTPWKARFSMSLRVDDRPALEAAQAALGIGTLHEYQPANGQRVARWMVQSKHDVEALVAFIEQHPLRAKKREDFEVWRRAVSLSALTKTGRGADNSELNAAMLLLKQELAAVRTRGLPQ